MIIAFSGSVGVGKTSIAKEIAKRLSYEYISLSDYAESFKIQDISSLQTFDFDLDKLLNSFEKELSNKKSLVFESHFSHFVSPKLVDVLVIINRDLQELKEVYSQRGYNKEKISDNLEVESFDLCFFEAEEEGYTPKQFIKTYNNNSFENVVDKIEKKLRMKLDNG